MDGRQSGGVLGVKETIMVSERAKQIAKQIFDELVKSPIGTRTSTSELVGIRVDDEKELWDIDNLLEELVRKDGRFILDSAHHAGLCEGLPFNLDFILLQNNHQRQDKAANDFAIAHGNDGACFESYAPNGICIYEEQKDYGDDEDACLISVDANMKASYIRLDNEGCLPSPVDEEEPFPWGKSIYEEYERKEDLGVASQYERRIFYACKDNSYEQAIDKQTMYRALEEAECLGMKVDIVPDPEFQPGGICEGQCDGWSYHPEVVTKEEYDARCRTLDE